MGRDLVRRLREANPVPPERVKGAADNAVATQTLASILEEPSSARRRRPAPRRRFALAAATVVTLAAVVAGVVIWRGASVQEPTLTEVLQDAAHIASTRDAFPSAGGGRYAYLRTKVLSRASGPSVEGPWVAQLSRTRDVWVAPNGSGRIRESRVKVRFLTPTDEARWGLAGSPPLRSGRFDRAVPAGTLTPEGISTLVMEPRGLLADLRTRARTSSLPRDVAMFHDAAELLAQPLSPPGLRASLYRVVALLPGVELLGAVEDPLGRIGTGVAITSGSSGIPELRTLIFDPRTTEVLAETTQLLDDAGEPGPVADYTAYEERTEARSIS